MKILVDMNLTPGWCEVLRSAGFQAVHWCEVGDPHARDCEIMEWAATNNYVVFTHDLDFGMLLAATSRYKPSVIQVRTEDIMPSKLAHTIFTVLGEQCAALEKGAIVVVDRRGSRVRILPIRE